MNQAAIIPFLLLHKVDQWQTLFHPVPFEVSLVRHRGFPVLLDLLFYVSQHYFYSIWIKYLVCQSSEYQLIHLFHWEAAAIT